ncbi:MAG: heavy metal-binding domain-containing protein [Anaerolineae bacterium]|jgi:uncharacterized protein YbjQ (UPF0145 family)
MIVCPKCGRENDDTATNCANCKVNLKWALGNPDQFVADTEEQERLKELAERAKNITITTTYSIEGRSITEYLDVLTAEVVLGTGLLSEIGGGIADFLGTRAGGFQRKLQRARELSLQELRRKAMQMEADAVVGADMDYSVLSSNMLMVTANGTAVRLAEAQTEDEISGNPKGLEDR